MDTASDFNPYRRTTLDRLAISHPSWSNPRTVTGLGEADLLELGDSILDRGQQTPMDVLRVFGPSTDVVDDETGEVTTQGERPIIDLVVDGQRRYLALAASAKRRKKGLSTIRVDIRDLTAEPINLDEETGRKILLDMVDAAARRRGLSSYEKVEVAVKFRDESKQTIAEVAKAVGFDQSTLSKFMRARRKATDELLAAWRDGKVTDEMFKDLAEVGDKDEDGGSAPQLEALGMAVEARAKGSRTARAEVRNEIKERAAAAKEAEEAPAAKKKPRAAAKAEKTSKPQLGQLLDLAHAKAPSDSYVKGIMHGVALALGKMSADEFSSPWRTYVKACAKAHAKIPTQFEG